jgi:hypothetical protein
VVEIQGIESNRKDLIIPQRAGSATQWGEAVIIKISNDLLCMIIDEFNV